MEKGGGIKKVNTFSLAAAYAGCFIGAGFLSGNELWQFFGSFGRLGLFGLVIAIVFQAGIGYAAIKCAAVKKTDRFDVLISPGGDKIIANIYSVFLSVFVFLIISVMFAGAASLIKSAFGLNKAIGGAIFAAVVAAFSLSGLKGVVKFFSVSVPMLVFTAMLILVLALKKYGYPEISGAAVIGKTAVLPNFFISALLFSSYNVFCALPVITPIGGRAEEKCVALGGVLSGSVALIAIAFAVLMPLFANSGFASYDLPLLELAKTIGLPVYYFYAALLIVGIFGTSVSSLASLIDFGGKKINFIERNKKSFYLPVAILAYALSLVGINDLIAVGYPVCGYVGMTAEILIVVNLIIETRRKKAVGTTK